MITFCVSVNDAFFYTYTNGSHTFLYELIVSLTNHLMILTSAGIYKVDSKIAGATSGMTNSMNQLGGPVGLSIIVLFTAQITDIITYYHIVMWMIACYMIVSFIIIIFSQTEKIQ